MNTPHIDDAAAKLAAVVSNAAKNVPDKDEVSLTLIQGVPEWLWKMLHPQGLDGKFIKKGTGTFLYGHTKSAFAKTSTGKDVSVPLEPGDKLWKTKNDVQVVTHPDGTAQIFSTKDGTLGLKLNPPAGSKNWEDSPSLKGASLIDESDAIEVDAPDDNVDIATQNVKNILEKQGKGKYDEVKTDAATKKESDFSLIGAGTPKPYTPVFEPKPFNWKDNANALKKAEEEAKAPAEPALPAKELADATAPESTGFEKVWNGLSSEMQIALSKGGNLTDSEVYYAKVGDTEYTVSGKPSADMWQFHHTAENGDILTSYIPQSAVKSSPLYHKVKDAGEAEPLAQWEKELYAQAVDNVVQDAEKALADIAGPPAAQTLQDAANDVPETPAPEPVAPNPPLPEDAIQPATPDAPVPAPVAEPDTPMFDKPEGAATPKASAGSKAAQNKIDGVVTSTKAGAPYGPAIWTTPDWIDPISGKPYLMSSQGEQNKYFVFSGDAQPMTVTNSKGESFEGLDPDSLLYAAANKKSAKAWIVDMESKGDNADVAITQPLSAKEADTFAAEDGIDVGENPYAPPTPKPGDENLPINNPFVPKGIFLGASQYWNELGTNNWVSYSAAGKWSYHTPKSNVPTDQKTLDQISSWETSTPSIDLVKSINDGSTSDWSKMQKGAEAPFSKPVPFENIPAGVDTTGKDAWWAPSGQSIVTHDPATGKWEKFSKGWGDGPWAKGQAPFGDVQNDFLVGNHNWTKVASAPEVAAPAENVSPEAVAANESILPSWMNQYNTAGHAIWDTEDGTFVGEDPDTGKWTYYTDWQGGTADPASSGTIAWVQEGNAQKVQDSKYDIAEGTPHYTSTDAASNAPEAPVEPASPKTFAEKIADAAVFENADVYPLPDGGGIAYDALAKEWSKVDDEGNIVEGLPNFSDATEMFFATPVHESNFPIGQFKNMLVKDGIYYGHTKDGKPISVAYDGDKYVPTSVSEEAIDDIIYDNGSTHISAYSAHLNWDPEGMTLPSEGKVDMSKSEVWVSKSASIPSVSFFALNPDGTAEINNFSWVSGKPVLGLTTNFTKDEVAKLKEQTYFTDTLPNSYKKIQDAPTPEVAVAKQESPVDTSEQSILQAPNPVAVVKFTKLQKNSDGSILWKVLDMKNADGNNYAVVSKGTAYKVYEDASLTKLLGEFSKSKDAKEWLAKNQTKTAPTPVEDTPSPDAPKVPDTAGGIESTKAEIDPANFDPFWHALTDFKQVDGAVLVKGKATGNILAYGLLDNNGIVIGSHSKGLLGVSKDDFVANYVDSGSAKIEYSAGDDFTLTGVSDQPEVPEAPVAPADAAIPDYAAGFKSPEDSLILPKKVQMVNGLPVDQIESYISYYKTGSGEHYLTTAYNADGIAVGTTAISGNVGSTLNTFEKAMEYADTHKNIFTPKWALASNTKVNAPEIVDPKSNPDTPAGPVNGGFPSFVQNPDKFQMLEGGVDAPFNSSKSDWHSDTVYLVRPKGYSIILGIDDSGYVVDQYGMSGSFANFVGYDVNDLPNNVTWYGKVLDEQKVDAPKVSDYTNAVPTLSDTDASDLNKATPNGVKVEALSEDLESPSTGNPTPGDPKAHLAVPVVGIAGTNGSYVTKKLKDDKGKPYFITSNGLPNHWEVYNSDGHSNLTYNKDTEKWEGDATPLATFKQLKQAKAWLAGDKETTGALTNDSVEDHGTYIKWTDGDETFYLTPEVNFWVNPDSGEKWFVGPSGAKTQYNNNSPWYNGDAPSAASLKKAGFNQINTSTPPDYLAAVAAIASLQPEDPEDKFDYSYANNADQMYYAMQSHSPYIGWYEQGMNLDTLNNGDSVQELLSSDSNAFGIAYKYLVNSDYAALHAKVTTIWENSSGADKTKARRILNRLEHDALLLSMIEKGRNGIPFTEGDLAALQHASKLSLKGALNPNKLSVVLASVTALAQRQVYAKRLKELGFDVPEISVNMSANKVTALTSETVEQVKKFAGEHNFEYAGGFDGDAAGKYLYAFVAGDITAIDALAGPMKKKAAVAKSLSDFKVWLVENGGVPASDQPAGKNHFGVVSKVSSTLATASLVNKVINLTSYTVDAQGNKWTYLPVDQKYIKDGDSTPSLSVEEMKALILVGQHKPTNSAGDIQNFTFADEVAVSFSDNTPGLWVVPATELANLSANNPGAAMFLGGSHPLLLSLIDHPNNPYAFLKDGAEASWKEYAKYVKANAPEWWDSDGAADVDMVGLKNALLIQTSTASGSAGAEWLAKTLLPFLKGKAPNIDEPKSVDMPVKATLINGKKIFPALPDGVDPVAWDLLQAMHYGQTPAFVGTSVLSGYNKNDLLSEISGSNPYGMADAPMDEILKGAYWVLYDNKDTISWPEYKKALTAAVETGVWGVNPDTFAITMPDDLKHLADYSPNGIPGKSFDIMALPGDKVVLKKLFDYELWSAYNTDAHIFIVHPDGSGFQAKNIGGKFKYFPRTAEEIGELNDGNSKTLFVTSLDLTHEFFAKHIPGVTQAEVDIFTQAKDASYADVNLPGFGQTTYGDTLVSLKKAIKQAQEKWAVVNEKFNLLSQGTLKMLHYGSKSNNDSFLNMVNLLDKFGQYQPVSDSNASGLPHPNINKNAGYYAKILAGQTTFNDFTVNWGMSQSVELAHDILGIDADTYKGNTSLYDQQMADILNNKLPVSGPGQNNSKANTLTLHKITATQALGGMHTKQQWADDNGEIWMSKAFASDPNSKARIEAEHYSMRIADLYGWNPPASFAMQTPDGTYAYVQHLAPSSGTLMHKGWNDLPENAMHQAMSQHVLDWIISNHDSHAENILLTEDGNSVYPIDRGQAFKFFGSDKLAVGYLPPGNGAPVWYDKVYQAIQSGSMPKDAADKLRDYVLRRAAIVATRDDEKFRTYVNAALANRKSLPSKYGSIESMVDAVVARKKSTFDDFQNFWEGVYKKAGYDFGGKKAIDDYLPKKAGKAHVSVTPDFSEDVSKANSVGVPLFFGGQEFDNGHLQVYTTVGKDGKTTLRMAGKLMPNAEQVLTNWLDQQSVEKIAHASSKNDPYDYVEPVTTHAQLPGLQAAHNSLVAYVTTVGSHIKKGDYEWNEGTVNNAQQQKDALQKAVTDVESWVADNPTTVFPDAVFGTKFVTAEQQDTWLDNAQNMLDNFAAVDEAKEKKISVSKLYPDKVPFHAPTYTPSANIDTTGKPKVVEKYEYSDGGKIEKYSDFNYVETDSSGTVTKISKADYEAEIASGMAKKVDLPADTTDAGSGLADDESVTVSAGTQIVKVTHRKAKFDSGTMDYNTGLVTDTASEAAKGVNGSEYLIEFDDVKIQFQHANDVNINSQKSLMRITISDWQNGGTQQIENALSTLRSMGLNLDPADEQDLELLYWRQMYGTLQNRKLNAKFTKVKQTLDKADLTSLDKTAEIEAYRSAFGDVYGPSSLTKFIEEGGHLPQMSKHVTAGGSDNVWAGRPYWLHPDAINMEAMKDAYKGKVLVHDISYGAHGNASQYAQNIAKIGFHSTEERMRVLGQFIGGMSSEADQGYGSSQYMFTRSKTDFGSWEIVMEPMATLRTSNYNLSGDQYGNQNSKNQSPFDQKEFLQSNSFGEIMLKNGASLMSDFAAIVVPNEGIRKELIKFYHDMGVTEIRGLPVEKRIVASGSEAKKALEESWKNIIDNQKKGVMPWHSE